MRVLWITFNHFPDLCNAMGQKEDATGSWVFAYAKNLLLVNKQIRLCVATPFGGKITKNLKINNIDYFLFPLKNRKKYNSKIESYWIKVKETFNPDVIHIHGSEYPLGLSFVRACGSEKVVLSIQGLVSVIERHYFAGITPIEVIKNISLRDILRCDNIISQRTEMRRRGEYEIELIQSIKHVIGRTDWDLAHSKLINPSINYHVCNENVRELFHSFRWKYDECEKYSIFLSQGQYPLKGLHQMIKALEFLIKKFPETKIYIAGSDIINGRGLKITGYGIYINRILNRLSLHDSVFFVGQLSELQMKNRLLKCNVFVCPSSIENSSVSTCEAQIMGVPVIASAVGGLSTLIKHGENGLLYRFEEPELLAWEICKVFSCQGFAELLSKNSLEAARERHDSVKISYALNNIYKQVANDSGFGE